MLLPTALKSGTPASLCQPLAGTMAAHISCLPPTVVGDKQEMCAAVPDANRCHRSLSIYPLFGW
ncbi:MAG: hypothetical protein SPJ13_07115 [Bacteroidales bacterium]|nr:hypothetical protein [Bacteroidales bacterium]